MQEKRVRSKKVKPSYLIVALAFAATSCATSRPPAASVEIVEPAPAEVVTAKQAAKPASAHDAFHAKIGDVTPTITSSPDEVVAGQAFAAPYVVQAFHADGSAAAGLALTVTYPVRNDGDDAPATKTETIMTDADGTARFNAPVPQRPSNASVRFAPAVDSADEAVIRLAEDKAVEAPHKVRTRYVRSGGSIALVDYTQAGKPVTTNSDSSSKLLTELMKRGFVGVGNADFTAQVDSGSKDAVYDAARRLFGNASAFLIYGTVRYAAPAEQVAGGSRCTLTADVICLNMGDGTVLYRTTLTECAEARSDGEAVTATRVALAKRLSEEIYYGM